MKDRQEITKASLRAYLEKRIDKESLIAVRNDSMGNRTGAKYHVGRADALRIVRDYWCS